MKSIKEDLKDIIHDNETNNYNTLDEQSFNEINNNRYVFHIYEYYIINILKFI